MISREIIEDRIRDTKTVQGILKNEAIHRARWGQDEHARRLIRDYEDLEWTLKSYRGLIAILDRY